MAHTYLLGCALAGMHVTVASPEGYEPKQTIVEQARAIAEKTGATVTVTSDVNAAVVGANVIATDTWASMGQESEHDERARRVRPLPC